ncbi:hypothetical protein KR093_010017 [Drosophila rubida]|uniref:Protein quiver n=1 Tax=Drosophila rubida TaxID=30044 RepID=A0AAD4K8R8_9MUSC|nr:hypothetical protein KR093_010017 [Drosophila rubida]
MYKKVLTVSVLLAFICVRLAASLSCYTCVNPNDCKKPKQTTCTTAAANVTSDYLRVYHDNVRNSSSSRFDCLALQYTHSNNNTVTYQLHGCVHSDVSACALPLKAQYSYAWRKNKCVICSGNNCNKSPAGKMSSSVYTIAAATLGLLLVKIYA